RPEGVKRRQAPALSLKGHPASSPVEQNKRFVLLGLLRSRLTRRSTWPYPTMGGVEVPDSSCEERHMSMNTLRRAGLRVAALARGGLGARGASIPSHASGVTLPGGALFQERAQEASIPDVAERVSPAVVSIYTSRPVAGPGGGDLEELFGGRGFGQ